MSIEKVIFGAGCFWGVQSVFSRIDGVIRTTCGYSGGHVSSPSYEMVCSGNTGHAEVVQVEYDPEKVTIDALLDIFWQCHDPTTIDRQGVDIGTQYRSVIYFFTEEQETAAKLSRDKLQQGGHLRAPVVTEILPVDQFYPAEDYHQHYLEKRGIR